MSDISTDCKQPSQGVTENVKKNVCIGEGEGLHKEMYLTWVHQSDGTCYYKCELCGWIKLEDNKE